MPSLIRVRMLIASLVVFIVIVPSSLAQEDKLQRDLAPEGIEKLLQELKIEFKKTASKKGDEHYFDFVRSNFRVRWTLFPSKDVMLDCVFAGVTIEKLNEWNAFTRVTRASFHKENTGDITILEYGLDLTAGHSTGMLKQYLARFDDELKKYEKFVTGTTNEDKVFAEFTDDKLEHVLKTHGINYQKHQNATGPVTFFFEVNGQKIRLYNFGKDLMMEARYPKLALAEVNRYNFSRKFIRAVNYKSKDSEYTALEINLDCEAGASEGMIRHWVNSFSEDTRHFAEYAKKLQVAEQK